MLIAADINKAPVCVATLGLFSGGGGSRCSAGVGHTGAAEDLRLHSSRPPDGGLHKIHPITTCGRLFLFYSFIHLF